MSPLRPQPFDQPSDQPAVFCRRLTVTRKKALPSPNVSQTRMRIFLSQQKSAELERIGAALVDLDEQKIGFRRQRMQTLECGQMRVEKFALIFEPASGLGEEIFVLEKASATFQRGTVDRPRLLMSGKLFDSARVGEQITEAKTRYAIVLGERAQDDEFGLPRTFFLTGFVLDKIDERFVNDNWTLSRESEISDVFYLSLWNQLTGDACSAW
jgi:hypothetical protein